MTYSAKLPPPMRESYQAIRDDILRDGVSYIRKKLKPKVKGWMYKNDMRWSFRTEGGRVKIVPMKE